MVLLMLVCTDCRSAISALERASADKRVRVKVVAELLEKAKRRTRLMWAPSHCGIIGNEEADKAANEAADRDKQHDESEGVGLNSAVALIKASTATVSINHERLALVYDRGRYLYPFTPVDRHSAWSSVRVQWPPNFNRQQHTLLAQLRSGHYSKLVDYARVINPDAVTNCPHCDTAPQDLAHWLQDCPAFTQARMLTFGTPRPELSVLSGQPELVLRYTESSLLRQPA